MTKRVEKTWAPSERFERAVRRAIELHRGQYRKGSSVPYVSHLFTVSALVMEYGGTEDQAIAALLHDSIEDAGATKAGLHSEFGETVARIVDLCSHDLPESSGLSYRERKSPYLAHVASMAPDALLVSIADKTHNARSILEDLNRFGAAGTWRKFSGSRDEVLWYYHELVRTYGTRAAGHEAIAALLKILSETVNVIERAG